MRPDDFSISFFYSILACLRYQLKLGLEINEKKSSPYFWNIEKKALFLKKDFFYEALKELFKIREVKVWGHKEKLIDNFIKIK